MSYATGRCALSALSFLTHFLSRYGSFENLSPSLFGISLYQQKHIELRPEGRRPFDPQSLFDSFGLLHINSPYLSQIPCSWGAVYFPEVWREFHSYLMSRFSESWIDLDEIVVPNVRSNKWTRSWKKFFIELVYLRGYVMLYPNYDDFLSLSTNHLEVGSHVKDSPRNIYNRKKALFTVPLLQLPAIDDSAKDTLSTGLLDLPEEQLPDWHDLPLLDLTGSFSSHYLAETRGLNRQRELTGCLTKASDVRRRRTFNAMDLFNCDFGSAFYSDNEKEH